MAEHTNMNNSTLFLLRYLAENTDMDHPVTSVQLQRVLASSDTGTVLPFRYSLPKSFLLNVHRRYGMIQMEQKESSGALLFRLGVIRNDYK